MMISLHVSRWRLMGMLLLAIVPGQMAWADGMVTMLDLGSKSCIPCKMMTPILDKLKNEYAGRANITFIDVYAHREEADRYAIRGIPTQIFLDASGNEVGRHVGFLAENDIVAQLAAMGVTPAAKE